MRTFGIAFALVCTLSAVACGPTAEDRQRAKLQADFDNAMQEVDDATGLVANSARQFSGRAAVPVTSEYIKASAKQICGAQYPSDFAMQGGCKRNMESGAGSIAELRKRYAEFADMQAALDECISTYTQDGATDFAMAGGCARNNEAGYLEMER